MASEAKVIVGYEQTSDGLKSMDETRCLAFFEGLIANLDHWCLGDHSVIIR